MEAALCYRTARSSLPPERGWIWIPLVEFLKLPGYPAEKNLVQSGVTSSLYPKPLRRSGDSFTTVGDPSAPLQPSIMQLTILPGPGRDSEPINITKTPVLSSHDVTSVLTACMLIHHSHLMARDSLQFPLTPLQLEL